MNHYNAINYNNASNSICWLSSQQVSAEQKESDRLGTPVEELRRMPQCGQTLPHLRATHYHKILIRVSHAALHSDTVMFSASA